MINDINNFWTLNLELWPTYSTILIDIMIRTIKK
jgi:hypothetical protein